MAHRDFDFLLNSSNHKRVAQQRRANKLLFEGFQGLSKSSSFDNNPKISELRELLSNECEIFVPNEVQKEIYGNDTGTAIMPRLFKRLLVKIKFSFIVRPVTLEDARKFMVWAYENKIHYTIRGAGTWPFGGSIPLEGAHILDLSYLDFVQVDKKEQSIVVGPRSHLS